MTFGESVRVCFARYAVFSGRARRSEFWWFMLFNALVTLAASIIDSAIGPTKQVTFGVSWAFHPGEQPLQTLVNLALLLPNLAVGARRLHDINRTGWWQLLLLVPCVGFIVLLVFWCTAGDRQPNRYGPPTVS
jgi:uncharacterized membrane protein YhaH (DUF805 family)